MKAEQKKASELKSSAKKRKQQVQQSEKFRSSVAKTRAAEKQAHNSVNHTPLHPVNENLPRFFQKKVISHEFEKEQIAPAIGNDAIIHELDQAEYESDINSKISNLHPGCAAVHSSENSPQLNERVTLYASKSKYHLRKGDEEKNTKNFSYKKRENINNFVELPEVNVVQNSDFEEKSTLAQKGCSNFLGTTVPAYWDSATNHKLSRRNDIEIPSQDATSGKFNVPYKPVTSGPVCDFQHKEMPKVFPVWGTREKVYCKPAQLPCQVQCYDHSSRYELQYNHPDAVQKIEPYAQKTAMDMAEETSAATEIAFMNRLSKKKQLDLLQQSRSKKALVKERLKHQYNTLLTELGALSRRERLARGFHSVPLQSYIHMDDERRKEQETIRQKNMNSVFESVYHHSHNAESGMKENVSSPHDSDRKMQAKTQHRQWRNISMEVEATLNVGCCILPQNATEKSISSFRSTNENSNDTDSTDNINNIKENTRPVTRECNKSVAECVSPIQKLMECISAQREELFSDKVTDSQGTVQENKATQTFNENTKNAEAVHISSISLPPRINVQNKVLANNDSKLHFLNTLASPSTNVATNEIHVDQLSQNVAPGSDATEKIENFLTRHNVPKVKPNGHSVIQNTDINIKEQKSFLKSANGKEVYTNGGNSLNEQEIHKTCMDSSSVHKSSFQTRNDKDPNIEEDLHSSSSSSTVISGYSLSQRRGDIFTDSNSMNSSTTASSGSVKIVFKLTEQHYDEVENHTAKNSQFEESYSIPVATAYNDGLKSSKNQKHCKKHCLKQHICTFPEDKVKNSEKFVHDNTYSRLIDESKLKSADNCEQVVHSDMKSDKNVTKSNVYGLHEYNNKNIVSDSRKRKQWQDSFSKNLDMSTNPTSASTSYFSPPEKISATGAEEIESLFGTIKSSEKYLNVNDVNNGPQISLGSYEKQNPNLACYIRRLLKMSRESVEDLSISSNEVSSQTGEILNTVMDNRSSYLQDSNLFSNKVCTPTKSDGESEEEFLKALLCKVKKQTKENVIRSSTRSQCEECEKTNGSLHSHQTYDTLDGGKNSCNEGNLKGHQSLGNICEHKDPLEKFNSSVNEQLLATLQSNNLVAAMNQRIISALNEINSVIDQVPSYASSPELPQPKTVSPTLPEVELNELAEKYSRRIMELTKKIENVRQEKQQILESSSSGSDKAKFGDSTVYMSPPTANQDQRLPENLLGQGLTTSKMDTTSMSTNSESFGEQLATSVYNSAVNKHIRLKPPATLSQKLSRNGVLSGTPHELSTIMEIDSTLISQSHTAFGCKSATNAGPSAEASRDPVISNGTLESDDHKLTADNPSSSDSLLETSNKDQHLTSDSVESITEIVAEMLRRNLLSSPYSWMEEDKIKKANSAESKIVLPTSHENIPQNERSDAGCEIKETDDVQLDIQNSSDSMVGIDDYENHRDIRTNVSQSDLHGMFQKLGIGWASSMLRKTQESMAYSSSSSDNTPVAASQLPRKDVLRDNTRISENKPNNAKKIHSIKGGIPSPSFAQESVMLIAGHSTPVGLDSEGSSTKQPNFSVTGESEISIIRPEFCNDESLDIKAPNVSLVPKLKFTNHSAESSS